MTLSRLQTLSLGSVPLRGLQVTYFEGSTLASVHQKMANIFLFGEHKELRHSMMGNGQRKHHLNLGKLGVKSLNKITSLNSSHLMRLDRLGRAFRHSDGSFTQLLQLLKDPSMVTVQLDDLVLMAGIIFHPLVLGIQEAYKLSTIYIFSFQGSSNWWSASEWFNKKMPSSVSTSFGFFG